jgi:hypothetical protein
MYSIADLSTLVLIFVAALTRNQNPCPAPVKLFFRAVVATRSVLREVYRNDPPESLPSSEADVDGRYCREYFVGLDLDGLPMGGHVTVMEVSSASTKRMPSLMVLCVHNSINSVADIYQIGLVVSTIENRRRFDGIEAVAVAVVAACRRRLYHT